MGGSLTSVVQNYSKTLRHARLTAIKSAFGLDIILVYTPLSK